MMSKTSAPPQHVTLLRLLQDEHQFVNAVDFVLDALNQWAEGIRDIVNQSVGYPIRGDADVVFQLLDTSSYILRMRCWAVVELIMCMFGVRTQWHEQTACKTYRKNPLTEDNDVHVERLEICRAVWVLVKATETNEIVVPEQLDLLPRFFHLDILRRKGVNRKDLNILR